MARKRGTPGMDWPAYTVERWPIARLKANERNARTHSAEQIEQIRKAIRTFGWTVPILVREDGTLIAGHGRLTAALAEGITEAPVIVARGWSEEQCRSYALADNKIALNSGWDDELLGVELSELRALGMDLDLTGFAVDEVEALLAPRSSGLTDPDAAPEPPVDPVSRQGDLWALGAHRVLCGDATSAEDVKRACGAVCPHLMVTDPPYGVDYDASWRIGVDGARKGGPRAVGKVSNDDRADWREAWALFPGALVYVWHGGLHTAEVQVSLEASGFEIRSQVIWVKQHFVFSRGDYHWQHEPCWYAVRKGRPGAWAGDRKQTTVWEIPNNNPLGGGGEKKLGHSTQKPVECMRRPIINNSSPGQAVYDPFLGSGTTIIAAEMEGRSCLGLEIDASYVDVVVKRWQDFTGKVATLEGDGRTFVEIETARAAPVRKRRKAA